MLILTAAPLALARRQHGSSTLSAVEDPRIGCKWGPCKSACSAAKDHFRLSITGLTNASMPYWRPTEGASLSAPDSSVTTAVIVHHGQLRDAEDYLCAMHHGLRKRLIDDAAIRRVLLVSPQIYSASDGASEHELYWDNNTQWSWGFNSSSELPASLSAFSVLEEMLMAMMDQDAYPNLATIIVVGHSAGGQLLQRFLLTSSFEARAGVTMSYFVANPGSVTYLNSMRPVLDHGLCENATLLTKNWSFAVPDTAASCPSYDEYGLGLAGGTVPPYAKGRSMEAMRLAFLGRNITYLSGSADVCACLEAPPLSDAECSRSDECRLQGLCHLEIVHAFVQHVRQQHAEMAAAGTCAACRDRPPSHNLVSVPEVGHNGCAMLQSDEALALMFPDGVR